MTTYLRFEDLKARRIVNNRVTLSRWIKQQGFPTGVKLGPNTVAWDSAVVEQWLASRPNAGQAAACREVRADHGSRKVPATVLNLQEAVR